MLFRSLMGHDEVRRQVDEAQRKENDALKSHQDLKEYARQVEQESAEKRAAKARDKTDATPRAAAQKSAKAKKTTSSSSRLGKKKRSRLRIKALASRLGETLPSNGASRSPSRPTKRPPSQRDQRDASRARRSTTRREVSSVIHNAVKGRKAKAKKHYEEGVKKLLDSNFIGASTSLKLATVFDPENEEYKKKYQVASSRAGEIVAEQQYKQARFHLSVGRWEAAARLLVQAADHHPVSCYEMEAAETLLKTGELRRAQQYAIRATESAPENPQARVILARVYKEAKMYRNARREAETALKLDPDNVDAKGLIKEVRKYN